MLMTFNPHSGNSTMYPMRVSEFRKNYTQMQWQYDPFTGLPRGKEAVACDPFGVMAWPDEPAPIQSVVSTAPGYDKLADVLNRAFLQASAGKGKERHASDGVSFEDQPMSSINRTLGSIDGFLFQAAKKAAESRRLPDGRAQAELLGAINYLAGAVIALDTWAKK